MCGICGVAHAASDRWPDAALLRRMTDAVRHRGPDSDGFHRAPGIGLGFRRLAIIDLATGDQPLSNEDETLTLVCNGEIYNFIELREELRAGGHRFRTGSDAEVILHLYEDLGPDCVQRLRGMFAFALWDAPRRRLMLARDRLGIKPLEYAITPEGLWFGSEMKSILAADAVERRLDPQALKDLFTLGFVAGPKTMMAAIRRLQPGHWLLYERGRATRHRYWDVDFPARSDEPIRRSAGEWADALREKLAESVRLHVRSDVPVGAWLSAGIDSSAVVALMAGLTREPVATVSLGFEDPDCDELRGARTLNEFPGYPFPNQRVTCRAADFARFPRTLWHCEDLTTSGIEIPHMLLAEAAARNGKVVLVGEGSDEVFGGYRWFRNEAILHRLARLPRALRQRLLVPLLQRWRPGAARILAASLPMSLARYVPTIGPARIGILDELFADDLRSLVGDPALPDWDLPLPDGFARWDWFAQLQYYEMKIRLPDFIIHHLDRTSMAYSLEARVPFLDHELVEFCAAIPSSLKLKGFTEKHVLREAMKPVLPDAIRKRKKRGLQAPFAQWMRDPLPEFAAELLSPAALAAKGWFRPEVVQRMLDAHRAGTHDHGDQLFGVLAVQQWDELFLKAA